MKGGNFLILASQHFSFSATSKVLSYFGNDGGENCYDFSGFAVSFVKNGIGDIAVFGQEFQPELGFVRFLKKSVQFRTKLGVRTGAACFPGVGCHGSS